MAVFVIHLATVQSMIHVVYNNYLKVWAPGIATICIAAGGIIWMFSSLTHNSSGAALGIKVAVVSVAALVLVLSVTAIVGMAVAISHA